MTYTPNVDYNSQLKAMTWKEASETDGLDFDYLFMDNNPDWDKARANGRLQAISYGIIYFLLTQNSAHLAPIILSMKEGHTATEAIASSYGNFDTFKSQFTIYYRYMSKSRFSKVD
jgi:hypothetical protein